MSLVFWLSLALLAVIAAGGTALVVVRAIELVRTFRAFGRVIAAGADRILNAATRLEQRAATSTDVERLERGVARLEVSVAQMKVLLRELRRVRATVRAARAAFLPK